MFYCLFEQSGTFKNEFKKLGYEAEDYDIQNEFGETDHIVVLFQEIRNAYDGKQSLFDTIIGGGTDTVLAFFPCIRFTRQMIMAFKGEQKQLQNKSDEFKLEYDLKLHKELGELYELITKLAIVCTRKNVPLIIENPYMTDHYLARYWAMKPQVIDWDRTKRGDYYVKPTQYFFINREPSQNMILEAQVDNRGNGITRQAPNCPTRSLISKEYANRFIREFIL